MAAIAEGKKAPSFTLEDGAGERVSLGDFKGKNVVVYFYPKDDTPGCTKEACGFRNLWTELRRAGVVVLGVSADDAESHTKFASKYKLPFPLLSDPDRKLMQAWGAYGDKMMYGKKTKGVIRSTVWIGPDGVVRKHWARVPDAAKHPPPSSRRSAAANSLDRRFPRVAVDDVPAVARLPRELVGQSSHAVASHADRRGDDPERGLASQRVRTDENAARRDDPGRRHVRPPAPVDHAPDAADARADRQPARHELGARSIRSAPRR